MRLALGVVLLCVALPGDAAARSEYLGFAVGAGFVAFAALADRRGLQLRRYTEEPEQLPADAVHDPNWRVAWEAALPSTVGVTVLGGIALAAGKDVLGAVLGGTVAGLGIASAVGFVALLARERERGVHLYVGSNGRRFVDCSASFVAGKSAGSQCGGDDETREHERDEKP